jgi:DNA topoisomerase VI subunit B
MADAILTRTTFQTSRVLEFFTEQELQRQIGVAKEHWPLALLKELIDNALDACEAGDVAPEVTIVITPDTLSVRDNGPGIPARTIERSLDYLVRVSNKSYYVSPTRGQLGNALKCVWAVPYVVNGDSGQVEVTTGGMTHHIAVTLDRIAQQPMIQRRLSPDGVVKNGTRITMHWPGIAGLLTQTGAADFYNVEGLVRRYAAFNPHATFHVTAPDGHASTLPGTDAHWMKWHPSKPTAAHWYTVETLRALLAAYLLEDRTAGRIRTVREFVAEFAGLKGTRKQKAVTDAAALSGKTIEELVEGGDIAAVSVGNLLAAMQQASRPVKAKELGVLGQAHLTRCLTEHAHVAHESVRYRKSAGVAAGLPYVLEVACGWTPDASGGSRRDLLVGLNWSPALTAPVHTLPMLLGEARVDSFDPVVVAMHLACPRLTYTDQGKTAVTVPDEIQRALRTAVMAVTKPWTTLKRQADKAQRVRQRELDHWLKRQQPHHRSVKEAAYAVMHQAYRQASGNGTYPANARQIMYAARPLVLEMTRGKCWKDASYFTQTLLPRFLEAYPDLTASWDVVFDARGHLYEPHTPHHVGLGTLEVRHYVRAWHDRLRASVNGLVIAHDVPTCGPTHRYDYALFIEKEGFHPLLTQAQIAERYDLALMSTKGMSVTAARHLVAELSHHGVTILVLHDFDKAGFSIVHTLRTNTRRWQYVTPPNVITLGLRLDDIQSMGLQREPVTYDSRVDPRVSLRMSGATEAECHVLVHGWGSQGWEGERVELNAMNSVQFIRWLEDKLVAVGVRKVVPDQDTLAIAYRRMVRLSRVQHAIDTAIAGLSPDDAIAVPAHLRQQLRATIDGTAQPWDEALWQLAWTQTKAQPS